VQLLFLGQPQVRAGHPALIQPISHSTNTGANRGLPAPVKMAGLGAGLPVTRSHRVIAAA
jgi:hypothetical protein